VYHVKFPSQNSFINGRDIKREKETLKAQEEASDILQGISHRLRIAIIESLVARPRTFSAIMAICGLNPNFDSGLFYYHLSELIGRGIVEKEGGVYRLTSFGNSVYKVIKTLETERSALVEHDRGPSPVNKREVKRPVKKVEIMPVGKHNLTIEKGDCELKMEGVYWGVTCKTVGYDKVCAVWPLSDGSIMYEMREPGYEKDGYALLHLKDDGLYTIEVVYDQDEGGEKATIRSSNFPPTLPLPLSVGVKYEFSSTTLETSTNAKVTGWMSIEGARRVKGEVLGQFKVSIGDKAFNCLLLREVIETGAILTRPDGEREKHDLWIRVMMDRYLNEKGKLRLEHLWYCHEGGRKSMTEEEARKSAGPIFQKINYMGKEWYRVDQVELDEPLPIMGAR